MNKCYDYLVDLADHLHGREDTSRELSPSVQHAEAYVLAFRS